MPSFKAVSIFDAVHKTVYASHYLLCGIIISTENQLAYIEGDIKEEAHTITVIR